MPEAWPHIVWDDWPSALKTVVGITLNAKFPKCIVWGPNLITIHNDAFRPILGTKPPALGRSFRDVWSEVWAEIGPIADRAYAGEATFIEDFPLIIDRYGYPEQAYFTFCYSPIRDEKGIIRGMMDTVIETTGKVEAQKQSRLLNQELEHRIKNTLTVVSAIVSQTLQPTGAGPEPRAALLQRIGALAQAQSLLTRSNLAEADIHDVTRESLAPFRTGDGRVQVDGPPVMLSSKQALTLTLAVNELATNAVKYGALSNETGQIRVLWRAGRPGTEDPFYFSWVETGGPPLGPPVRKGFGSRIIERVLAQDFSGQAALMHDPSGIRCELTTQMWHIGESPRP
ncbi:sensor histidine kinase [Mesorhizobium sp. M7A.F.Ca.US.010.02.1.1]|nr:sensor histidine kinase [Mesorhizobium sp. M7A.F.Ca.US.010.02.1.1]